MCSDLEVGLNLFSCLSVYLEKNGGGGGGKERENAKFLM